MNFSDEVDERFQREQHHLEHESGENNRTLSNFGPRESALFRLPDHSYGGDGILGVRADHTDFVFVRDFLLDKQHHTGHIATDGVREHSVHLLQNDNHRNQDGRGARFGRGGVQRFHEIRTLRERFVPKISVESVADVRQHVRDRVQFRAVRVVHQPADLRHEQLDRAEKHGRHAARLPAERVQHAVHRAQ